MLNGLIYCGECGKAYSGNTSCSGRNKQEYSTYRCGSHRNGCDNKDINVKYINNFVLDILIDRIFTKTNTEIMLSAFNKKYDKLYEKNKNEIIKLKNKLVYIDSNINKLTDILTGNKNLSSVIDRIHKLEQDKDNLTKEIKYLTDYTYKAIDNTDINNAKKYFKKYLLKYDRLICRKFIRSFIDRIDVYNDRIEVTFKNSDE